MNLGDVAAKSVPKMMLVASPRGGGAVTVRSFIPKRAHASIGVLGAVSHFLLALAYQRAPASQVVPYMYSQVGFAVLFGWIVFSELPGTLAGTGIALIILSGLGNAWQLRLRQRP
jgi:uncharacterized membrane protein